MRGVINLRGIRNYFVAGLLGLIARIVFSFTMMLLRKYDDLESMISVYYRLKDYYSLPLNICHRRLSSLGEGGLSHKTNLVYECLGIFIRGLLTIAMPVIAVKYLFYSQL